MFWNVYLDGEKIDMVSFTKDCDAEYVYKALVDHDGYDPRIVVKKDRAKPKKKNKESVDYKAHFNANNYKYKMN